MRLWKDPGFGGIVQKDMSLMKELKELGWVWDVPRPVSLCSKHGLSVEKGHYLVILCRVVCMPSSADGVMLTTNNNATK